MHLRLLIALAAAGAAFSPWAAGQPVYRCGNSYSQQPCAGGTVVNTGDTANPLNMPPGSVAASEAVRAEAMEKMRLAQEKNAPKAVIIGREPDLSRDAESKAKPGKIEQFTAVAPGHKPEKKKAAKKKKKK